MIRSSAGVSSRKRNWYAEDWRRVTSLRVYYRERFKVEFGLTSLVWAALPVDPGTASVVSNGMRILVDGEGRLGRLQEAVAAHQTTERR